MLMNEKKNMNSIQPTPTAQRRTNCPPMWDSSCHITMLDFDAVPGPSKAIADAVPVIVAQWYVMPYILTAVSLAHLLLATKNVQLENTKPPPNSFQRVRNTNASAEESEVIRKQQHTAYFPGKIIIILS